MRRFTLYVGLATALVASCSIREENFETPQQDDVVYYASFEQPAEEGTRVYVNEDLLLRWTADDRVSIFEKNTYNQQFRFTGATGDNVGGFKKVGGDDYHTGNSIPNVVSVYPYLETTTISESGVLVVNLPAEQHYAENSFGLGANTMVSVTSNNFLQYKNVCGYLVVKLYGEGVSVSSITLRGNNGERLAGKATVTMPQDGTPTIALAQDAAEEITLVCDTPVALGATVEESVDFWFVVPPVTFSKGFTVTVSYTGGVFEKVTNKSVTIERNTLSKMSSAEVEFSQPRNVIYYTSTDGSVVTPYNPNAFCASIISNDYHDGIGIIAFDGDVTLIGEMAFMNRTTLSSIILPNSVTSVERMAFYECSNLENISLSYGVTKIGGYAFRRCPKLSSVTIPDSVIEIGGSAFAECTSLSDVSLPDNLECISIDLFHDCPSLDNIIIPETVTTIKNSAFWNCSSLSNITIPDGVTSIGYGVFRGCNSLNSFKGKYSSTDGLLLINSGEIIAIAPGTVDDTIPIPSDVTSIGVNSFAGCDRIGSIVIPQGVTTIKVGAFSDCKNLTCVTIREGLISIGSASFESCEHLTSVIIPETVVSIGDYAFADCSNLDGIIIPSSTTSIGRFAFRGCKSLSSIIIPNGINYLEQNMFENCAELDSVILPDNLIGIGYSSFSGCSGLQSIVIPETVKGISSFAFAGCSSLRSVVLPSGVSIVDEWAYYGCNSLNSITVLSEIPPSGGSNMFGDTNDCPIYVPAGSVDAYKSAQYWSDYSNRIQAISE